MQKWNFIDSRTIWAWVWSSASFSLNQFMSPFWSMKTPFVQWILAVLSRASSGSFRRLFLQNISVPNTLAVWSFHYLIDILSKSALKLESKSLTFPPFPFLPRPFSCQEKEAIPRLSLRVLMFAQTEVLFGFLSQCFVVNLFWANWKPWKVSRASQQATERNKATSWLPSIFRWHPWDAGAGKVLLKILLSPSLPYIFLQF